MQGIVFHMVSKSFSLVVIFINFQHHNNAMEFRTTYPDMYEKFGSDGAANTPQNLQKYCNAKKSSNWEQVRW